MSTRDDGNTGESNPLPDIRLTPDDEAAIDELVERAFDAQSVRPELRARAGAALRLFALLTVYTPSDSDRAMTTDTLIAAALGRIRLGRGPLRFQPATTEFDGRSTPRSLTPFRWTEAFAAAAAILVLLSMSGVMLSSTRAAASRQACRNNLHGAGLAFTGYGADHSGELPRARRDKPIANWRSSRANAANLFTLVSQGYISLDGLTCPKNRHAGRSAALLAGGNWETDEQVSFSYQNMQSPHTPKWDTAPRIAVLGDRNPIIDYSLMDGAPISPTCSSFSHERAGQNILFNDGAAIWMSGPIVDGDNVWLPDDLAEAIRLHGVEHPASASDAMLVH